MRTFIQKMHGGILSLLSTIIVILAGLAIGLIVLMVSDINAAFPAFSTIISFGASSLRNIGDVLMRATPLIMTGLSVTFAYKTGLFNIGAAGQFAMGGFVAIYIGLEFTFLPSWLRIITAILAAGAAGAVWGAIPGLLKAYRNVHEVITSIMTNYIAMHFLSWLIQEVIFDMGRTTTRALPTGENAIYGPSYLPSWGLEQVFVDGTGRPSGINIGIFIAIIIAVLVYIVLNKTAFGYELKACGLNKDAAKYAGINQNTNIVRSMMICGAIAGFGGALWFLNDRALSMDAIPALVLTDLGFTGIAVAFLGLANPIGVIFSSIFISYIFAGGARIQGDGFSLQLVEMVISVIIYFCAFVLLVKTNLGKILFRRKD